MCDPRYLLMWSRLSHRLPMLSSIPMWSPAHPSRPIASIVSPCIYRFQSGAKTSLVVVCHGVSLWYIKPFSRVEYISCDHLITTVSHHPILQGSGAGVIITPSYVKSFQILGDIMMYWPDRVEWCYKLISNKSELIAPAICFAVVSVINVIVSPGLKSFFWCIYNIGEFTGRF